MQRVSYLIWLAIITFLVNFLLRALPFIILGNNKKTNKLLQYIGNTLPPAMIAMLSIYCLGGLWNGNSFFENHYAIGELSAVATVILLHLKWHNPLLSIGCGTALYMLLLQKIFPLFC